MREHISRALRLRDQRTDAALLGAVSKHAQHRTFLCARVLLIGSHYLLATLTITYRKTNEK